MFRKTFHVSYFYSCFADATVVQTQSIHSNIFKHQERRKRIFRELFQFLEEQTHREELADIIFWNLLFPVGGKAQFTKAAYILWKWEGGCRKRWRMETEEPTRLRQQFFFFTLNLQPVTHFRLTLKPFFLNQWTLLSFEDL